jgi:hypothetical protein
MELEELKSVWASIDEQFKEQKILKENIIRKMICDRSNKSLSKLMNYEILCMAIYFVVIPIIVFLNYFEPFRMLTKEVGNIFIWAMLVICIVGIAWSLIKIIELTKMDFTKSINDVSLLIIRYNILIRNKKIAGIVLIPVITLGAIWLYVMIHANTFQWTSFICALIVSIFLTYYVFKRVYDRNITVIRQSLEELEESLPELILRSRTNRMFFMV